jgi:hypothetical protein
VRRGRLEAQSEFAGSRWLSTSVVLHRTGITMRQLQYWVDRRMISPEGGGGEGRGHPRRWSEADVELVLDMIRRVEDCPYDHPGQARLR